MRIGVMAGPERGRSATKVATMLDVLETSSGQSAATSDKFQQHVLTGSSSSGFANSLMAKDVRLYLHEAADQDSSTSIGRATVDV